MSAKKRIDNSAKLFRPTGELTIYTAIESKASLMQELTNATALQVDLSSVTKIDSAGLQLLMLAKKEAQNDGIELRFVGHSDEILEVFDLCNLAGFFGDPLIVPKNNTSRKNT